MTTTKRILALLLCLLTILPMLVGCGTKLTKENPGSYITMYLTDDVVDFDPARSYYNDSSLNIASLLFETLFTLDAKGKVQKQLVANYSVVEKNRYGDCVMTLTLNGTTWSNGLNAVTADDIVFAWKRILKASSSYEAAALLFDIKNARAVKEGDASIDDLGVYAVEDYVLEIIFEEPINYDHFIMNLTSLALAPLLESYVNSTDDWAKKSSTCPCSGPFKIYRVKTINIPTVVKEANSTISRYPSDKASAEYKLSEALSSGDPKAIKAAQDAVVAVDEGYAAAQVTLETYQDIPYATYLDARTGKTATESYIEYLVLERNPYYYRNNGQYSGDALDKNVKPYRIIVQCGLTDEQIQEKYDNGELFFIGDIPLSLRETYKKKATVAKNSLSTFTYYLNEDALISSSKNASGEKIFAIPEVRKALSLALDRQAIADTVVFADPATGLVPTGVFNTSSAKKTFRKVGGNLISASADLTEAKALLSKAGITASNYSFAITVAPYDDVQMAIAQTAQAAWSALGFNVTLNEIGFITNNDIYVPTNSIPTDIVDDLYAEALRDKNFEVIGLDLGAFSTDAYSMLAPFALPFSGQGMDMSDDENYKLTPHLTGYSNPAYDEIIEAVFAEKKDLGKKAELLHEAEELLIEDMPVIPVIFTKTATLCNKAVKGVETNYYSALNLKEVVLKDWESYVNQFRVLIGLTPLKDKEEETLADDAE